MELLVNPDFENGSGSSSVRGWVGSQSYGVFYSDVNGICSFETSVVQHGLQAIQIAVGTGDIWATAANADNTNPSTIQSTAIPVYPNFFYHLKGWIKSSGFTISFQGLNVLIIEYDVNGNLVTYWESPILASTQDWTLIERVWKTQSSTKYFYIQYIRAHGSNGILYADNFSLREVNSGYFLFNFM